MFNVWRRKCNKLLITYFRKEKCLVHIKVCLNLEKVKRNRTKKNYNSDK